MGAPAEDLGQYDEIPMGEPGSDSAFVVPTEVSNVIGVARPVIDEADQEEIVTGIVEDEGFDEANFTDVQAGFMRTVPSSTGLTMGNLFRPWVEHRLDTDPGSAVSQEAARVVFEDGEPTVVRDDVYNMDGDDGYTSTWELMEEAKGPRKVPEGTTGALPKGYGERGDSQVPPQESIEVLKVGDDTRPLP